jgi:hypothetical protein
MKRGLGNSPNPPPHHHPRPHLPGVFFFHGLHLLPFGRPRLKLRPTIHRSTSARSATILPAILLTGKPELRYDRSANRENPQ